MPKYTITTTTTSTIPVTRVMEIIQHHYPTIPRYAELRGIPVPNDTSGWLNAVRVSWDGADATAHTVEFTPDELGKLLSVDGFVVTYFTKVGPSQLATTSITAAEGTLK